MFKQRSFMGDAVVKIQSQAIELYTTLQTLKVVYWQHCVVHVFVSMVVLLTGFLGRARSVQFCSR